MENRIQSMLTGYTFMVSYVYKGYKRKSFPDEKGAVKVLLTTMRFSAINDVTVIQSLTSSFVMRFAQTQP